MAKTTKTAATVTSTAVATSNQFKAPTTQAEIPGAIEQLRAALAALQGAEDKAVTLDVNFTLGGRTRKIKDIDSVLELIEIEGAIEWQYDNYKKGVAKHGLEGQGKEFQIDGKGVGHWTKVIAKAISELRNKKQIETIKGAIKKLESHLDEATKLQNTLSSIAADVNIPLP